MSPHGRFQIAAQTRLATGPKSNNSRPAGMVRSIAVAWMTGRLMSEFRPSLVIGGVLILSGLFHLMELWITGSAWDGPLSARKPALFGVSAGVTVWSIAWVLAQLDQRSLDRSMASLIAVGLLLEVGLITLQQWRGVASHFNRATALDATIESTMFGLILLVTAGIAWLCWRSNRLPPMLKSRVMAINAGLWLLLISCGLGLLATILGEVNLAHGRPPEVWGPAGVLKYPHGAALHAIQTLPLLSILLQQLRALHSALLLRGAVLAHVLFMTHALWQTLSGRGRFDFDAMGYATLAVAGLLLLLPVAALLRTVAITRTALWSRQPPVEPLP